MKTYRVGVSIMGISKFRWFSGIIDGCRKWNEERGKEEGISFDFDFRDSKADTETMKENLKDLIAENPEGMLVFPVDDSSAVSIMKEGKQKGITFVLGDYGQTIESEEDRVWSTFVAHNMYDLGAVAGEIAADNAEREDPVLLFVSNFDWGQSAIDRYKGFQEAVLSRKPKARIICVSDIEKTTYDSVEEIVQNVLQQEERIDIVSGHNDALVIDSYRTFLKNERTEARFIGIAGDRSVLGFIEEGNPNWLGEVIQDSSVLGYWACEALYRAMVLKEELPESYELPRPLGITKENIQDFKWRDLGWL